VGVVGEDFVVWKKQHGISVVRFVSLGSGERLCSH